MNSFRTPSVPSSPRARRKAAKPKTAAASRSPMTVEALEMRIAPAAIITAILTDNTNSPVGVGGTIHYTEVVTNTATPGAANDAVNLAIANTLGANLTFVPGSLNVSPLALDDVFAAVGNTQLYVGQTLPGGTIGAFTSGNIFANDMEFANDLGVQDTFTLASVAGSTFTSGSVTATTAQGGTVVVYPDGTFVYTPAVGFSGADTFSYTITDDGVGGANALTGTGTVTLNVANKVWYVDSAYTGANGAANGTSLRPFTSITTANLNGAAGAGDVDGANDFIFIARGNGTAYTGGLILESGQHLIGAGSNLSVGGFSLVTGSAANAPTLSHNTGTTLALSTGNDVQGLHLTNSNGSGITGTNVGNLTIANADVVVTGGPAVSINGGTLSVTLAKVSSTNSSSNGISLINTGGTFTVTGDGGGASNGSGGVITGSAGHGVNLVNASGVSLNYMNITNSGSGDATADGIHGEGLSGFTLNRANVTDSAGNSASEAQGVSLSGALTGTFNITNSTLGPNPHDNLQVRPTSGTITAFNVTNSTLTGSVGNSGMNLNVGGSAILTAFTMSGSTVSNNFADGIQIDAAGTATITLATIQNSNFTANNVGMDLANTSTGSVNFKVLNNNLQRSFSHAINIFGDASNGVLQATVQGNTIGTQGTLDSGSAIGSAVRANINGQINGRVLIDNNQIREVPNSRVIEAIGRLGTGGANFTITNNTISAPSGTNQAVLGTPGQMNSLSGIYVEANTGNIVNARVSGNVVNYNPVTIPNSGGAEESIRLRATGPTGGANPGTLNLTGNPALNAQANIVTQNTVATVAASTANGGTITVVTTNPGLPPLLLAPPDPTVTPELPAPETPTTPAGDEQDGILTRAELDGLIAAAIARWEATGLTPEQSALLRSITFDVADLPGYVLGQASPGHVTLDLNGSGIGWFVDATPLEDSEFATGTGFAAGHVDALTTVMHELGHQLGLSDTYNFDQKSSIMYGFLHLGERRAPGLGQAENAVPETGDFTDFALSPINAGRLGNATGGATTPITLPGGKSLTINFDATIDNATTASSVSTQGIVTANGGISVLTNDPDTGAANDATVTAVDLPDVSVGVSSAVAENSGGALTYTFSRTGPNDFARTVSFNISGSATFGGANADYTVGGAASFNGVTGTVTFAAGSSTATVTITPTNDNVVEANENITLTVTTSTGAGYDVGTPNAATGTINNDDAATVSISGGSVAEGNAATANLPFTVTLSNPVDVDVTLTFATSNGTALAGSDYTAQSGITITIPAGQLSATQNVLVTGDTQVELNETLNGTISNLNAGGRNVSLGTTSAAATITNDDSATVTITAGSVVEGNAGTANLPFTITLSNAVDSDVTVLFSTANGTATIVDADYVAQSGVTVTIPAGSTSVVHNVVINGDSNVEADETVTGTIASPSANGRNVTLGTTTSASGTITNDDALVTLGVAPASVAEDGSGLLTFTFTRTGFVTNALTVNFGIAGSATFNTDYTASSTNAPFTFNGTTGTVTFAAGASTATVTIDPTADTIAEGEETVALTLGSGTGYGVGTASAVTGTILDDDTKISLGVSPASITEASGTLTYTFTRTGDTALPITVNFTYGGTALFTTDYTQSGAATFGSGVGTVLIPAGASSATVILTPNNDTIVEGNETALLTIAAGTGYGIDTNSSATGTITDNDTAVLQLTSATSTVGEAGGSTVLTVGLVITANGQVNTGTLGKDVSVNLQDLLTGLATGGGSDYTFTGPSTLTFATGSASATQDATITLVNDTRVEGTETINFQLNSLSDTFNGQVSLGATTGHTVTITDNDFATISLAAPSSSVSEAGGTQTVGVVLSITANGAAGGTLDRTLTVNLADLLSGTAIGGGSDYTFSSPQTITFNTGDAGQTKNATITIVNDARLEGNETIDLQLNALSSTLNGQVSLGTTTAHTVTINDTETATISVTTGSDAAEETAIHNVGVTLAITADVAGTATLERALSVNLNQIGGNANNGGGSSDYTLISPQTVTFDSGEAGSTKNIVVTIVNDTRVEGAETIALQLDSLAASGTAVSLGNASHTVTILDNDTASISLSGGGSVAEDGISTDLTVTLTITANGVAGQGSLERAVSVSLAEGTGSATGGGSDFSFTSPQTITFASGATSGSQTATVGLVNDTRVEGTENISFGLGSLVDGTSSQVSLGTASAVLTITDNDTARLAFVSGTSSVSETGGTHNVGVALIVTANGVEGVGTIDRTISVNVSDLLTGTALPADVDYSLPPFQTLTFTAGSASGTQNVVVGVINDAISEGNETINLGLGNVSDPTEGQVTLGTPTTHTVTIVDNDVDLRVTKTGSVNSVVAGSGAGNLVYTITVTNDGLTDATGVVLSEDLTLPAGVTLVSATPSTGSWALTATPDGTWTLGSLAAGASATLTITLTVGSSATAGTGTIGDTAAITTATENLINPGNDSATLTTDVTRAVDLLITKTDGVTSTTPGSVLVYGLTVSNAQPSDANGVVITETVPAGTSFNAGASTPGWVAQGNGVYTFNLGTVGGNSTHAVVNFAVTVDSVVASGLDSIVNTATVVDDGTATLNPANLSTTDTDTLNAAPDLVLTKTLTGLPSAVRGGDLSYVLSYKNLGNQDANKVVLTEILPANTTFDAGASTAGWVHQGGGVYTFALGPIAGGGGGLPVTFAVTVNSSLPAGTTSIVNTASIADDGSNGADPTPGNNSSTRETPLYQGIYVVSQGVALPKKGGPANVLVYDVATNTQIHSIAAYEPTYRDSVRVATGDINGDGYDDIITSTRTGTGRVRVFDGVTGAQFTGDFAQIDAFDGRREKGAFVASGDVTGDGRDDLIIGTALGGGSVKIYDGVSGDVVTTYKPFGNAFKGGVRVAVGDVNNDGTDDVIVGQGYNGASVKVYDGASSTAVLQQFKVGPASFKGGISVAAGDVDGDGDADIITGRNTGKPTQIEVFQAMTSTPMGPAILPFGTKYNLGVRVAAADVNFDGIADIIAGSGGRNGSAVKFYDGVTHAEITGMSFAAFPAYPNSALFVAGSSPVPAVRTAPLPA